MIEHIGAFAGLAAFVGLAVLALLSFTQARDIRRLRDWAGSAPERDAERKEATSAIAAQRAEELRALQDARTAEHTAVVDRAERRRRREAGLPEGTGGERARTSLSGFGERLGEPRWLILLFVVLVVGVGAAGYAVVGGSGGGVHSQGRQAVARLKPSEIEVTVLNGTAVPGLASTFGDKIEGKGFTLGAVTNSSASFAESVVMFKPGHRAEAQRVAKQLRIPKLRPMNGEVASVAAGADVAVVVGEDNAAAAS